MEKETKQYLNDFYEEYRFGLERMLKQGRPIGFIYYLAKEFKVADVLHSKDCEETLAIDVSICNGWPFMAHYKVGEHFFTLVNPIKKIAVQIFSSENKEDAEELENKIAYASGNGYQCYVFHSIDLTSEGSSDSQFYLKMNEILK